MDDNRQKALEAALAQIEKQYGKGSIMKMDDAAIKDIDVVSTGSLGLDIALGVGGLKMKIHKACIARLFERNDLILDAETIAEVAAELGK